MQSLKAHSPRQSRGADASQNCMVGSEESLYMKPYTLQVLQAFSNSDIFCVGFLEIMANNKSDAKLVFSDKESLNLLGKVSKHKTLICQAAARLSNGAEYLYTKDTINGYSHNC